MQTKKELKHSLVAYKKILTNSIFDYLNSILELEFSVLKENISDDERKLLTELSIYREIAIYNIYNRALKLIKEIDLELPLEKDHDHSHIALVSKKEEIPVFSFEVNDSKEEKHLLGTINLHKRVYDASESKLLLESTEKALQKLRNERNPHNCNAGVTDSMEVYDGPDTWWAEDHDNEIRHYENILKRLNDRKELTIDERKMIEITSTIYSLLLKDYGLCEEELIDEKQKRLKEIESIQDKNERFYALLSYDMQNYQSPYAIKKTENEKVVSKKLSNITINGNIRYVI